MLNLIRKNILGFLLILPLVFAGCLGGVGNNTNTNNNQAPVNNNVAPILNNLVISDSDSSSITLQHPTFSTVGDPAPTINAYIGINGVITASGSTVGDSITGPIDVSSGDYSFTDLIGDTNYKIIVVAENTQGYSVKQIIQSTASAAPILNNLFLSGSDSSSITLQWPTFSTAGNPAPTVNAYIGVNGTITVSGSTVSNSITGPVDVSSGDYQFTGLNSDTDYKIIVVAENYVGYSVQQIVQTTADSAPVLNNLVISSSNSSSITLQHPTFSIISNPAPTVQAYIGVSGTISVSGSTVSNSIQGPIDVSSADHQFTGLNSNTSYEIIVVAINNQGYSVQQVIQSTANIVPILNNLVISNHALSSITLQQPTFSVAGNPAPTVQAYVGLEGSITTSGSSVTGSLQGPVDVSLGNYSFTGLSPNTNYEIIVIAENSQGYSVRQIIQSTLSGSSVATVRSSAYKVSAVISGAGIITNVAAGTSKATFEGNLAKGESNQVWDDSHISATVTTGDYLVVTAQNGITTVTYTVTIGVLPTYNIGDPGPATGKIFYDQGNYTGGWRYLEVPTSDQSTGIQWYNGSYIAAGGIQNMIGLGQANTTAIVASQGAGSYAAKLCDALVLGGKSDWFLPSSGELYQLYINKNAAAEFMYQNYWSSTEYDASKAYGRSFYSGTVIWPDKNVACYVRCVRAF